MMFESLTMISLSSFFTLRSRFSRMILHKCAVTAAGVSSSQPRIRPSRPRALRALARFSSSASLSSAERSPLESRLSAALLHTSDSDPGFFWHARARISPSRRMRFCLNLSPAMPLGAVASENRVDDSRKGDDGPIRSVFDQYQRVVVPNRGQVAKAAQEGRTQLRASPGRSWHPSASARSDGS